MSPPSPGATAGARAINMAISDKALAARVGPKTSRTIALARLGPTQAPMPCRKRKPSNSSIRLERAQPAQPATNSKVPAVRMGLRPKRSDKCPASGVVIADSAVAHITAASSRLVEYFWNGLSSTSLTVPSLSKLALSCLVQRSSCLEYLSALT